MNQILGQKIPLTIIKRSLEQSKLHHSLWFNGPENVGKFETAIKITKSLLCKQSQTTNSNQSAYCDRCAICWDISLLRHKNLIVVSNDDRLKNIYFYQHILKHNLTRRPKSVTVFLLREIYHLLYRHNMDFLLHVERVKKSYAEGEKISNKALEELIQSVYLTLEKFYQDERDLSQLTSSAFYKTLTTLQNCLDRSLITRSGLEKVMHRFIMTANPSHKSILILQNIERWSIELQTRLLKIVEETPPNTVIVILTENIGLASSQANTLNTLKSRCLFLEFKRLTVKMQKKILIEKFGLEQKLLASMPELTTKGNFAECFELITSKQEANTTLKMLEQFFSEKKGFLSQLTQLVETENNFNKLCQSALHWLEKNIDKGSKISENKMYCIARTIYEVKNKKHKVNISNKNLSIKLLTSVKNIL